MRTYQEQYNEIIEDSSVSNILKEMLKRFDQRDILDALADAELLVSLMQQKFNETK